MREPAAMLRERPAGAVHASRMAALIREAARGVAIALAVGALLAFAGAFETQDVPLGRRLAYWLPMMPIGALIGAGIQRVAVARGWLDEQPLRKAAFIAVTMAVPLSVAVWAWTSWMFWGRWRFDDLLGVFPPVLAVCLVISGITALVGAAPTQTHARAGDAPPRFLERLPFKLKGAEVYAVEAEDHYLRIHTSKGSDLILMRLSDAIAELEGIEGAQTHRSWWVAKSAVTDVERSDGRATLTIADGAQVPVSRTFARALRAQHWF